MYEEIPDPEALWKATNEVWIAEEAKKEARKNPSAFARANVEEDVTFIVDKTEARNGGISNISNIPDIPEEEAGLRDDFVSFDPGFESGDASNYEGDAGYGGYQEDQNNQGGQCGQGGQGGQRDDFNDGFDDDDAFRALYEI